MSVSWRLAGACSASARSRRSSRTWASRLPSLLTEAISSFPSGSSRPSSSIRSISAESGLRSWCEASATKARCCSRTCSTLSAISLNDRARRRSSGGPPPGATRDFIRPVAMPCAAASRVRTGRSTQLVSRKAAPTASSIAASSPAMSSSQPCRMRERSCPVGESVTTTATTSPSRTTGEATARRACCCQGQTWLGSWLRRPARASWNARSPSVCDGTVQPAGAAAMAVPSR